ncbi:39S ribosomal protein L16, mitochondrial-like isoform X2 [Uloborus diversus]|uniref:39S ribosomal protein L16, mitochondrial-like isoform X1 n=1 Tax=Uloborus diversus TaxID=327109 RepID=UPI00240934A6|nr:39S ribosomal protein L16, mitochondrial-like isoform X1 [Uloborus diversus]XP_054717704.1 39S ribosomal protein L16, mitochondrial-like isoform X2 [Uloborus diversus]
MSLLRNILKFEPFSKSSYLKCVIFCTRGVSKQFNDMKLDQPPPSFEGIELPEQRKLPVIAKIPQYYINQKPPLLRKLHNDLRGPERIHNTLLHGQYGIIALSAGYLKYGSIEVIRNTVNRELDTRRMFAVWRIDPLWKPVSKKSIGKRMGGGKGSVHHYVTAVRAGRIVIEVGGKAEYSEVYPFLNRVAQKMPFDAIPVSKEKLDEIEKEAIEIHEKNINPFSFKHSVEKNMQGCYTWISEWDRTHFNEYI